MKVVAVLFVASLALASAARVGAGSELQLDLNDAKNRPVSKVITLLKDMLKP